MPKRELIEGIRDSLRKFEEPYSHGEWENFQLHRRGNRRKFVPLWVKLTGIAASLFLVVYASVKFIPFFERKAGQEEVTPMRQIQPSGDTGSMTKDTVSDELPPTLDSGRNNRISDDKVTAARSPGQRMDTKAERKPLNPTDRRRLRIIPLPRQPLHMDQLNEEPRNKVLTVEKQWDSNKNIPYRTPKKATYFSFPNLRPLTGIKAGIDGIKMGFNFNPAFSNKGFSLGGGMSASIPWSDRLSTEIGATYTVLTIGKDMEAVTADTISTQLTGMRNTVGMVALPISINYLISENFSAGIGLTPFKVVRDQRTDILASYRWTTGGNSAADTIRRLITERSKVRRSDSLYKNNTYWGFIQLSGRIHPPILRRYHTVVAPYINVPIGTLHNDRYRWLNGGVSIRVYLR